MAVRRIQQSGRARRLATDCIPVEYDLQIEVDPQAEDTYRGEVAIQLRLARERRSVELHADALEIASARVEAGGREQEGRIRFRPASETVEISFPRALPAGTARLHVVFRAKLRDDLRGLYKASSGSQRYALTQLEAADARRFFPCFDEPAFKARFRVAVTTAATNTVLANSPVAREQSAGEGRKTVHFLPTPPLSTYLVALAVGPLESSPPTRCGQTEIRVWHVPGKGALTAFSLEVARETLSRLERYFDLPYPYGKLDLVAAPDFEAGAMENAGAVFFRETLLLVDPASVTLNERKRVAEVICHELAHMWYGDLVTMAWWDDLWLNEAFATWMAYQIVDDWKPEWKMWHGFEQGRAAALSLDALASTHPIYTVVRTPAEATANFDLITYEKGAAVVRMVERYLGPKAFRAGVRAYIRKHREGNAVAADLWNALSKASGENVEPIVRAWIEQPGFPRLSLRRLKRGNRTLLELRQQRFHARPSRAAKPTKAARWPIPVVVRVGGARAASSRLQRHLLTRAREEIELADGARFVYGNAEEGGFFRPLHAAEELSELVLALPRLAPIERMGLVSHQWAHVRAGFAPIESLLEVVAALGAETDPDVLQTLRAPLGFLADQIAPAAGAATLVRLRGWLVECFGQQLETLGWEPAARESDETKLRRAAVLAILGEIAEWEPVVAEAERRFPRWLANRASLEPNLADTVATLAARVGNEARFDSILSALGKACTPQERRRLLLSLAEFRERALVDRALAITLTETVQTQDVVLVLGRALANRDARERAWAFVKRRWSALRHRLPPMLATRLVEVTPNLQTPEHRRDVAAFFKAHPLPTAKRALAQSLERFDLNAELRRRAAPGLTRWLEGVSARETD
jgi:puromycin-sensitive aminopeptidase